MLSDRFRGAQAIALRRQPIPHAYRVFFRHIGLDPDEHRTPVEALALERLKPGGFALALGARRRAHDRGDGDRRAGVGARRRPARGRARAARGAERGERLGAGEYAHDLPGRAARAWPTMPGRSACCSARWLPAAAWQRTTRITLLALQVAGVPDIHVEEALWSVAEILTGEG